MVARWPFYSVSLLGQNGTGPGGRQRENIAHLRRSQRSCQLCGVVARWHTPRLWCAQWLHVCLECRFGRDHGDVSGAGHATSVLALSWSPDGEYIAIASWDETVQVWRAATGEMARSFHGHAEEVTAVRWSPDGRFIAVVLLELMSTPVT